MRRLAAGALMPIVAGVALATATLTPPEQAALERARSAASALVSGLSKRLVAELSSGGPAQAVSVCAEVAPQIARDQSVDGMTVRRVSARTRNHDNQPDEWERDRLEALAADVRAGREVREVVEWVGEPARELRYLKPIVIGASCLACHGDPEAIAPEVRQVLAERYPSDAATGYRSGDLRGAVSVRVPLGR